MVSWLQVGPLALVLIALVALPAFLFLAFSFFDYDRTGIYPTFMLDNYKDLLTTPATWVEHFELGSRAMERSA